MIKRSEMLIRALEAFKDDYLSGKKTPILKYKKSEFDGMSGYIFVEFYFNESYTPFFTAKTHQCDWKAFAEKILDDMQKVAVKWLNDNKQ